MKPSASPATLFANPSFRWSAMILLAVLAGALLFQLFNVSVFERIGMPHEFCYLRDPQLITLHVVSDLLIGIAYVSISGTLAYLVFKANRNIPFHWIFLAFGMFIVSCGITHFMEVWVVWEPVYWLSGYAKLVTGIASAATAIALFPLLPKVFRLIESARQSERRRVEIEQLNGELERFNYSVAHDLRAPLRGIRGLGQALQEDFAAELPPRAREYIGMMQDSAARMDTLIADLLKYAVVGRQEQQRKAIPLDEMVRSTQTLLEAEIRERKAVIKVPEPLPTVFADVTLLQVVFLNLLGNAIKFVATGVRPEVVITARTEAGKVTVSVVDNGLGIPAGARDQIFRMFERHHPQHTGTGIGLAIAHRAIERLDGRIGFTDAPTGTGTCFWFELPQA